MSLNKAVTTSRGKSLRLSEHISNIKIQVEILKVNSWCKEDQTALERLEKIDKSLSAMMNEILRLCEKTKNLTN